MRALFAMLAVLVFCPSLLAGEEEARHMPPLSCLELAAPLKASDSLLTLANLLKSGGLNEGYKLRVQTASPKHRLQDWIPFHADSIPFPMEISYNSNPQKFLGAMPSVCVVPQGQQKLQVRLELNSRLDPESSDERQEIKSRNQILQGDFSHFYEEPAALITINVKLSLSKEALHFLRRSASSYLTVDSDQITRLAKNFGLFEALARANHDFKKGQIVQLSRLDYVCQRVQNEIRLELYPEFDLSPRVSQIPLVSAIFHHLHRVSSLTVAGPREFSKNSNVTALPSPRWNRMQGLTADQLREEFERQKRKTPARRFEQRFTAQSPFGPVEVAGYQLPPPYP